MRVYSVIGWSVVFICFLLMSYHFSIKLLQSVGITGWMAHVAAIGIEAIFIFGVVVVSHGIRPVKGVDEVNRVSE